MAANPAANFCLQVAPGSVGTVEKELGIYSVAHQKLDDQPSQVSSAVRKDRIKGLRRWD